MELGYRLEYPSRNRDGVGHLHRRTLELPNPNRLAFSGCLETGSSVFALLQLDRGADSEHQIVALMADEHRLDRGQRARPGAGRQAGQ